jgi:hypothetical protein
LQQIARTAARGHQTIEEEGSSNEVIPRETGRKDSEEAEEK